MGREQRFYSPWYFLFTESIGMKEYACRTVIPEGIIKFWFTGKFISPYKHSTKKCWYFLFWCINRIHIHLIFSIVSTQLYKIIFTPYYIHHLKLIENTIERTKWFTLLFPYFSRNHHMLTSWKSKWKHSMCRSNTIWKWYYDIVYWFDLIEIISFIIVLWNKIFLRTPEMISHVLDQGNISWEWNLLKKRLRKWPISIIWWFLWEPPSKSYC